MTGVAIAVTVESDRVRAVLRTLAGRAGNLKPAFAAIGRSMVVSTQQRMQAQHGPDGKPWPALSAATLLARAGGRRKAFRKDGQTLRKPAARIMATAKALLASGLLRASLTSNADGGGVEVGTNRIYAAVQQFGAEIHAKDGGLLVFGNGTMFARKVTIPARPFLGVDAGDEAMILSALAGHLDPGAEP